MLQLIACLACALVPTAAPADEVIDFGVKGGWCWFQDERAIVDGDKLIFGSVASPSGDVNVTTYDLASGESVTVPLHARFQSDDHDAPAFLKLPDGRYLAAYASHGGHGGVEGTDLMRWRISSHPGDATQWEPEQTLPVGASVSYANLYRLSAEGGRIYNFHRGVGFDPNYLVSDDDGRTFRYGGRLFDWPSTAGQGGSGRPYPRYASNGVDTIHVIVTEDHPRNYDNSIYHGFIRGGQVHGSAGEVLSPLSNTDQSTLKPTELTLVYRGDPDSVAWTTEIRLDDEGHPYIAFSVQKGDAQHKDDPRAGGEDLRYFYGRFDGARWHVHEMAHAGTRLYSPEVDYTGLVGLHPADPDVVYLSSNAHPSTGEPLISPADGERHWEIFRGFTTDGGRTWEWSAVTTDSDRDNIRPMVRGLEDGRTVVLWLAGVYRSYTSYDLEVAGRIE
jgi:hypothetical protein